MQGFHSERIALTTAGSARTQLYKWKDRDRESWLNKSWCPVAVLGQERVKGSTVILMLAERRGREG